MTCLYWGLEQDCRHVHCGLDMLISNLHRQHAASAKNAYSEETAYVQSRQSMRSLHMPEDRMF